MRTQVDVFDKSEVELLEALKLSKWECISGHEMNNLNFAWGSVIVQTSNGPINLISESRELDFEGYWDDYSKLHLRASAEGCDAMKQAGHVFYFGQGESIQRIWLIRDTVTFTQDGRKVSQYTTDSGFVFELDRTWISLMKSSHRTAALSVDVALRKSDLQLGNLSGRWESNLVRVYSHERQWIAV